MEKIKINVNHNALMVVQPLSPAPTPEQPPPTQKKYSTFKRVFLMV